MSYLGAVTSAVGGELQGWASVLAKQAMGRAFKDELGLQEGYRRQGTGQFEGALPAMGAERAREDIAAGSAQRMRDYGRNTSVPLGFTPPPNAPTASSDIAYGNIVGKRQADLGGYSNWGLEQMIRNIRLQQALDKTTNFAGGDAAVYPLKMYKAQHSMDALAQIGAAISALGGSGATDFSKYTSGPPSGGFSSTPQGAGAYMQPYMSGNFGQAQQALYNPYTFSQIHF